MIAHAHIDLVVTGSATRQIRSLKWAGLLVAVCVPTVFWVLIVHLGSKAAGFTIGAPALTTFGLLVGCWCLAVAAAVMTGRLQAVS
jgi:hypothetical protein